MRYKYKSVERTPETLMADIVYVNNEFEIATLLCACGCGHRITLLIPDGHQVENKNGFATISPSIGVWDASCKSHFYVTNGEIDWYDSWSDEAIKRSMLKQRMKHEHKSRQHLPWYGKLWLKIKRFFRLHS